MAPFEYVREMFTKEKILHWEIEFDKELTTRAYFSARHQCTCAYCRNFRLVSEDLGPEFYAVMQKLGIDSSQPAEIVHYNENPDGTHHYGWWYHVVGQIASGAEFLEELAQGIEIEFRNKDQLAPTDFPRPIIQVEFFANLPWLLVEKP